METKNFEVSIEIAAPTEAVWKAISEAEEITKWFAPVARVKPGLGGEIFLSWGPPVEGTAPIRIWEPGKRLGWVEGEGTERPRLCEYVLEGRGESTTVLRVVQSGFSAGASFDDEVDSLGGGWQTFFAMLRYGLERFPGAPAVNAWTMKVIPVPQPEAWKRAVAALGIASIAEGAAYKANVGGIDIAGRVVRHPKPGYLCLNVSSMHDSLLSVFVEKGGDSAMFTFEWILYNESAARADEIRAAYERYFASAFPPA